MQQHVLDDRVGALAVLNHLVEIAADGPDQFVRLFAFDALERRAGDQFAEFVDEFARQRREVVDEIGFLISCAMPAVSWPREASFSDWMRRSWAFRRLSSEAASSRVLACT